MGFLDPGTGILLADGGLATTLEARGHDLSDPLWSARLLVDGEAEIVEAHRAFFRAGATIATTAGYQASFDGLAARGIDRRAAERLLRRAVELAGVARDEFGPDAAGRPRLVAASVGPYGAARADGSEYRGRYGLSVAALSAWHRPRLEVLAAAAPDVLALETVPDAVETEALVAAIAGLGVPAWLSYTIDGARTRAGQPLAEAFAVAAAAPEVVAVGVNCCHPADVAPAITLAREVTGKPVIVYPNSGEQWDGRRWVGQPAYSADLVRDWARRGAAVIGGCCRVGPALIAEAAGALSGLSGRSGGGVSPRWCAPGSVPG